MNLGNESELEEIKKSTGEHKGALQTISAMLNKHEQGELYFGVKDDGEVTGQEIADSTVRQIGSWITNKIEPVISPTIERLTSKDGKVYLRVAFSGTEAPYSADGRFFIRVGTSNNLLSPSDLEGLVLKRANRKRAWDFRSSGTPISNISEEALKTFVIKGNEASRIRDKFTTATDVLTKLSMIAEDGTLTNAAVELFCQGSDAYPRMKLGLLAGNDKVNILDLRQESGPLIELLDRAEYFVISNIRRELIIGKKACNVKKSLKFLPKQSVRPLPTHFVTVITLPKLVSR